MAESEIALDESPEDDTHDTVDEIPLHLLDEKELDRVRSEACIRPYLVQKLEQEAKRNWDIFYKHNTTNFFKDRHWLTREFPLLTSNPEDRQFRVLEVGCGVGNTIFPLLKENPRMFVYGCDLSPRAVALVQVEDHDFIDGLVFLVTSQKSSVIHHGSRFDS